MSAGVQGIVTQFPDGRVQVECGPMRMLIGALRQDRPCGEEAQAAAVMALSYLERVAAEKQRLMRPAGQIDALPEDAIVREMIQSTAQIGDADLTPMAAVAGTLADWVADWLFETGMSKVVVDNGGDVAIRLAPGQSAVVGVCPRAGGRRISQRIQLEGSRPSWGVATSGLGGRSFTRGIASAASVVAQRASLADAAATAIANACFVPDAAIRQVPAESLDPATDIPGIAVTVRIGKLSQQKWREALGQARAKALALQARGLIAGALIRAGNALTVIEPAGSGLSFIGD